jgi:hypothetical protein
MREVLPTAARDEDIQDTLNGTSVVCAGATSTSRIREELTDKGPLSIGEMNPAHAGMLFYLASVSKLSVELGFAHYLGKRVYLLNPVPDQPYILDEVLAIVAKVLDGDVRNL